MVEIAGEQDPTRRHSFSGDNNPGASETQFGQTDLAAAFELLRKDFLAQKEQSSREHAELMTLREQLATIQAEHGLLQATLVQRANANETSARLADVITPVGNPPGYGNP